MFAGADSGSTVAAATPFARARRADFKAANKQGSGAIFSMLMQSSCQLLRPSLRIARGDMNMRDIDTRVGWMMALMVRSLRLVPKRPVNRSTKSKASGYNLADVSVRLYPLEAALPLAGSLVAFFLIMAVR
jgi:hypothetical protein